MIEINGIKYAESAAEMVDSLFNNGDGTLEMLPAVLKKALKKAAAEYKARAEFQAYADRESEKMEAKFKAFQAAYAGLTAEQKKTLSSVTVTDKAGFDAVCAVTQVMSLMNK